MTTYPCLQDKVKIGQTTTRYVCVVRLHLFISTKYLTYAVLSIWVFPLDEVNTSWVVIVNLCRLDGKEHKKENGASGLMPWCYVQSESQNGWPEIEQNVCGHWSCCAALKVIFRCICLNFVTHCWFCIWFSLVHLWNSQSYIVPSTYSLWKSTYWVCDVCDMSLYMANFGCNLYSTPGSRAWGKRWKTNADHSPVMSRFCRWRPSTVEERQRAEKTILLT